MLGVLVAAGGVCVLLSCDSSRFIASDKTSRRVPGVLCCPDLGTNGESISRGAGVDGSLYESAASNFRRLAEGPGLSSSDFRFGGDVGRSGSFTAGRFSDGLDTLLSGCFAGVSSIACLLSLLTGPTFCATPLDLADSSLRASARVLKEKN
jgi:hypothetical protein